MSNPKDHLRLLTAKEVEALLKIDVKTIYGYVRKGLIPYVRIQSNVRFVEEEILEWVARQSYRPRQDRTDGLVPRKGGL